MLSFPSHSTNVYKWKDHGGIGIQNPVPVEDRLDVGVIRMEIHEKLGLVNGSREEIQTAFSRMDREASDSHRQSLDTNGIIVLLTEHAIPPVLDVSAPIREENMDSNIDYLKESENGESITHNDNVAISNIADSKERNNGEPMSNKVATVNIADHDDEEDCVATVGEEADLSAVKEDIIVNESWVQCTHDDASLGAVVYYYYNTYTGESQWEPPAAWERRVDEIVESAGSVIASEQHTEAESASSVSPLDANIQNSHGESPLHIACAQGLVNGVRLLLQHGAVDVNARDFRGRTALHALAAAASSTTAADCAALLLQYGAEVDARDYAGSTPLHLFAGLAGESSASVAQLLLMAGANRNAVDGGGNTALHLAAVASCFETMQLLVLWKDADDNSNAHNSAVGEVPVGSSHKLGGSGSSSGGVHRPGGYISDVSEGDGEGSSLFGEKFVATPDWSPRLSSEGKRTRSTSPAGVVEMKGAIRAIGGREEPISFPHETAAVNEMFLHEEPTKVETENHSLQNGNVLELEQQSEWLYKQTDGDSTAQNVGTEGGAPGQYTDMNSFPESATITDVYGDRWITEVCPTTGYTYYVSERTGESSWDYPSVEKVEEAPTSSPLSTRVKEQLQPLRTITEARPALDGDSEQHLAVWNRFFENALTRTSQRQSRAAAASTTVGVSETGEVELPRVMLGQRTRRRGSRSKTSAPSMSWARPLQSVAYDAVYGRGSREGADLLSRCTALFAAVIANRTSDARALLLQGVPPSPCDGCGRTPLHHACRHRDVDMVGLLCEFGADTDARCSRKETPLFVAANRGAEGCVSYLLLSAAEVNCTNDEGDSPLHAAARKGHFSSAKALVEYGAALNLRNSKGQTALAVARCAPTPRTAAAADDLSRTTAFLEIQGINVGDEIGNSSDTDGRWGGRQSSGGGSPSTTNVSSNEDIQSPSSRHGRRRKLPIPGGGSVSSSGMLRSSRSRAATGGTPSPLMSPPFPPPIPPSESNSTESYASCLQAYDTSGSASGWGAPAIYTLPRHLQPTQPSTAGDDYIGSDSTSGGVWGFVSTLFGGRSHSIDDNEPDEREERNSSTSSTAPSVYTPMSSSSMSRRVQGSAQSPPPPPPLAPPNDVIVALAMSRSGGSRLQNLYPSPDDYR